MENALYATFSELNISYEILEHEPFFTCEESADFSAQHEGAHCKTLFLRDKKKRNYFLAVVQDSHYVDTKKLCADMNCAGGKLSFGSAEDLEQFLNVIPGSVTPFALLHDLDKKINRVLIDNALKKHGFVYFHPMRNTATVKLTMTDFENFLAHLPHETEFYNFPSS